jgi:TM2 domain-containing membrane protein YozV
MVSAQQVLGELAVEPVEKPNLTLINPFPEYAILIVYSDIAKLSFATNNRGVIEAKEIDAGVWQVKLWPGTHIITYTAEGFRAVDDRIYIESGKIGERRLKVLKEPPVGKGTIIIETDPPGAKVTLDNAPIANPTPLTLKEQLTGEHKVRIEMERFLQIDTTIKVEKDKSLTYKYNLEKKMGRLEVKSRPDKAEVFIYGNYIGETPVNVSLQVGKYELLIKKPSYDNYKKSSEVKHNEITKVEITLSDLVSREKMKRKKQALWLSAFIPGSGQIRSKQTIKGVCYLAAFASASYLAYDNYSKYNDANDRYKAGKCLYYNGTTQASIDAGFNQMQSAYDDMKNYHNLNKTFLFTVGAVWAWNIVDCLIWGGGNPAKFTQLESSTVEFFADNSQIGLKINLEGVTK